MLQIKSRCLGCTALSNWIENDCTETTAAKINEMSYTLCKSHTLENSVLHGLSAAMNDINTDQANLFQITLLYNTYHPVIEREKL